MSNKRRNKWRRACANYFQWHRLAGSHSDSGALGLVESLPGSVEAYGGGGSNAFYELPNNDTSFPRSPVLPLGACPTTETLTDIPFAVFTQPTTVLSQDLVP